MNPRIELPHREKVLNLRREVNKVQNAGKLFLVSWSYARIPQCNNESCSTRTLKSRDAVCILNRFFGKIGARDRKSIRPYRLSVSLVMFRVPRVERLIVGLRILD